MGTSEGTCRSREGSRGMLLLAQAGNSTGSATLSDQTLNTLHLCGNNAAQLTYMVLLMTRENGA